MTGSLNSTHNLSIYKEMMKIILQLSSNTHLKCSEGYATLETCHEKKCVLDFQPFSCAATENS